MIPPKAPARTAHDKHTLEDFALKGMHYAKMTGVMAGAHAIDDSFLLMHSGVGCKYKTASQAAQHDLAEHPNVREAWTQVSEADLIKGCSERIGPFARAWWERRRSALMVVVSAYFIELTGDDIPAVIADVEATLPDCDMVHVPTRAPNHGFFDGYAAVLHEVMKRSDWSGRPTADRQASVLGHFFHRYEPDARADVAMLGGLLKVAGLEPGPVLFSGAGYAEARRAPASRYQVVLPYVANHGADIAALAGAGGRRVVEVDLPMGFGGTARFLRAVAGACGGDVRRAEAWATRQRDAVQAQVLRFAEVLNDTTWAVFADTPTAAGLVTIFQELGVRVPLVGLRDTHGVLGGAEAFRRALRANGGTDAGVEVLQEPSLRAVRQRTLALLEQGLTGIVGSSHEIAVFRNLPPSLAQRMAVPLLEVGFPADQHHTVLQVPSFGYQGVGAWAERLVGAVLQPRVGSSGFDL